jgi:peptidoglycan/LPS O-acetylase OafA/YrhL
MTANTTIRTFPALDGLRGIAALLVALFHFRCGFIGYDHYPAGDGYLAVDLFFVLSGFVLAHAYLPRFHRGLSIIDFMKVRFIRLYPLYVLGLIAGTIILAFGFGRSDNFTSSNIASSFALETFMLPSWPTMGRQLFPINSVSWSLFFEVIVNLLFVIFWRSLSLRALAMILAASGSMLCAYALYKHKASAGNMWGYEAIAGMPRVIFSFSLGLLIHRLYETGELKLNGGSVSLFVGIVVLVSYLLIPVSDSIRGLYDLGFIFVVSPSLVVIGTSRHLERSWVKLFSFLGATSYALYAIHSTAISIVTIAAHGLFKEPPVLLISVLSVASMLALSYLLDLFYDGPVRRVLMTRLFG